METISNGGWQRRIRGRAACLSVFKNSKKKKKSNSRKWSIGFKETKALFEWWVIYHSSLIIYHSNIITHHPITHFLSLKNPQDSPQLCLALQAGWVFIPKTQIFSLYVGPTDWLSLDSFLLISLFFSLISQTLSF